ncbi:MAG: hypothetical protein AAGJ32_01820 [Pseudomonadota bacterium]
MSEAYDTAPEFGTFAAPVLQRFRAWVIALTGLFGAYGVSVALPFGVRRMLRRELRQLERVARRYAWLMSYDMKLPPLAPPECAGTDQPSASAQASPSPPGDDSDTSQDTGHQASPSGSIPLMEPLMPIKPMGTPGTDGPISGDAPNASPDRPVPIGHMLKRLAALQDFAHDPVPLARRYLFWRRAQRAGRITHRILPFQVRYPPEKSDTPMLPTTLSFLHRTVHCRGSPDPVAP